MSVWFYLWLVLSAGLVYFMGWTLLILHRQKRAWKAYAAQKKLRYTSGPMMASPELSGVLHDYSISLFTGEHVSPEQRTGRKLTAVEINLSGRMPFDMAVASAGMVEVVRGLALKEEFRPESADWDKSWVAGTASRPALEAYLTPPRLEALMGLMKTDNAWVIFVCRGDTILLRLDTPDPLDMPKKIDALLVKMIEAARVLELKDSEDKILAAAATRKTVHRKTAKIDAEPVAGADLRLEEEGPA